ncbi:MAG: putative multitransmembrane protein [Microgenomates bacterium 39_7]|nr:MAG: putative multitransmembrane protein [Microgenomates bacterium 39_7]
MKSGSKKLFLLKLFLLLILVGRLTFLRLVQAQESMDSLDSPELIESEVNNENEIIRAQVIELVEEGEREVAGVSAPYQLLKMKLLIAELGEPEILLEHGGLPVAQLEEFRTGEQVFINFYQPLSSLDLSEVVTNRQASISTRSRDQQLLFLFVLFMVMVIVVNGFKGIRSLLSLFFSFVVIFFVALPILLRGYDPSLVIMLLALFIIPPTFYLTHGVKQKTHVAVAATVISLILSSLLAITLINTMNLSGLATEEAAFLSFERQDVINIRGLLLAGIILGLLGTLDDVTVTQAGMTFSLKKNKPSLKFGKLFSEAMEVGQDHIGSMVNTLVLVYTGASLPLLLLFINNPHPLSYVLSQEVVVEEIVRILVSSVGLIIAAPLTTFLASAVANWDQIKSRIVVK